MGGGADAGQDLISGIVSAVADARAVRRSLCPTPFRSQVGEPEWKCLALKRPYGINSAFIFKKRAIAVLLLANAVTVLKRKEPSFDEPWRRHADKAGNGLDLFRRHIYRTRFTGTAGAALATGKIKASVKKTGPWLKRGGVGHGLALAPARRGLIIARLWPVNPFTARRKVLLSDALPESGVPTS